MKHTEGKWEYTVSACNSIDIVSAGNEDVVIASIINDENDLCDHDFANANRIVQCVNSHDELVGYLQTLIDGIASQCDDGLDRFDWMVKQAEHIDKRLKALENARKS